MGKAILRHSQMGMSLVEILVGLAIGIITVLAIMQTVSVSEGQRRTSTGGSDALTATATALYLIERQARMAGYGMDTSAGGMLEICRELGIKYYYNPPATANTPNPTAIEDTITGGDVAPLLINTTPDEDLSDAGSHMIQITYNNNTESGENGTNFTQPAAASSTYKVDNRAGFRMGDLILAVENGKECTIAEVTNLPASGQCGAGGSANQSDNVIHNNGNYKNFYQDCQNVAASWNKPSGLGISYTSGKLYNLGNLGFSSLLFTVRDQSLRTCTRLSSAAQDCSNPDNWIPVVEGIVAMRARYGVDNTGDGVIDIWTNGLCDDSGGPCTPTREQILSIKAVRIAVVAINGQFERDVVTANAPQWLTDGNLDTDAEEFDLTHLPDWQRFRYRVMETTIPLRNLIWAQ